jgi:hypothetical protein
MTMRSTRRVPWLAAILAAAGCDGATVLLGGEAGDDVPGDDAGPPPDAPGEVPPPECTTLWDCNPGMECGALVPCIAGACRPDVPPVWTECPPPESCRTDSDCVVADPYDCCVGCPEVLLRSDLPDLACYRERGTPPPEPPPVECLIDCLWCPPCYPQPLAARCEAGACVAAGEGCPAPAESAPRTATPAEVAADPAAHDGGVYALAGTTLARWPACDDDCAPGEPCCSAALYVDGVVRLEGSPCDARLVCEAEEACDPAWECAPFAEGARYEFIGEVEALRHEGPILHVQGVRELEPEGFGGRYDWVVTSVRVWAEDPDEDCATRISVGDAGSAVFADAAGALVVSVRPDPSGWCYGEYWGSRDGAAFAIRIPIDCDGCCCDYEIDGRFTEAGFEGLYRGFDGICHAEFGIDGTRS